MPLAVAVVRTMGVLSVRLAPVATNSRSLAAPPPPGATELVPPLRVMGPVPEIVIAVGLRSLSVPMLSAAPAVKAAGL